MGAELCACEQCVLVRGARPGARWCLRRCSSEGLGSSMLAGACQHFLCGWPTVAGAFTAGTPRLQACTLPSRPPWCGALLWTHSTMALRCSPLAHELP